MRAWDKEDGSFVQVDEQSVFFALRVCEVFRLGDVDMFDLKRKRRRKARTTPSVRSLAFRGY